MKSCCIRDTDGDGVADERKLIVHLETEDDYPHNGLGGIAQLADGSLLLCLGENHGFAYTLTGSDGTKLSGTGGYDGVIHATADGGQLEWLAHGVWNPFSICVDPHGPDVRRRQRSGRQPALPIAPHRRRRRLRLPVPVRPRRHPSAAGLERRAARHAADGLRRRRSADRDRRPRRQPVGHQLGRSSRGAVSARSARRIVRRRARNRRARQRRFPPDRNGRRTGWIALLRRLGAPRLRSARHGPHLAAQAASRTK